MKGQIINNPQGNDLEKLENVIYLLKTTAHIYRLEILKVLERKYSMSAAEILNTNQINSPSLTNVNADLIRIEKRRSNYQVALKEMKDIINYLNILIEENNTQIKKQ